MKNYLSELLCDKIKAAFPRLEARLGELLRDAEATLARLGAPRNTSEQRRSYLVNLAQKYEQQAKDALERPWQLDKVNVRVRRLVREGNDNFAEGMRSSGHVYSFEDYDMKEEDYMQRFSALLSFDVPESQHVAREGEDLFAKIREEIANCGCTELPGQVHPDIIPRLYREQTRNWRAAAEKHLRQIGTGVMGAAEEILDSVCPRSSSTAVIFDKWLLVLRESYDDALNRALGKLEAYCDGDQTKLLQITDPAFAKKLRILRSLRMVATLTKALKLVRQETEQVQHPLQEFEPMLFNACHHSTAENTANEVHDILKVYYQVRAKADPCIHLPLALLFKHSTFA